MNKHYLGLAAILLLSLTGGTALADDDKDEHEGASPRMALVANAKWKAECGSCHTLYHPRLLPAQSWRKLMAGLDKHFGENASLDAATSQEITDFLVKYSGNLRRSRYERDPAAAPLRITETAHFKREHREIAPAVWKRPKIGGPANCAACHAGAEQGDFSEHRVRIPR